MIAFCSRRALGEPVWRRDARGRPPGMRRDAPGRIVRRIGPGAVTTWRRAGAGRGIGIRVHERRTVTTCSNRGLSAWVDGRPAARFDSGNCRFGGYSRCRRKPGRRPA